jgi:adhesin transport system membrane fusion protein
MHIEQETFLRARLAMLQDVIASQEQSVQTFERRLERSEELRKSGLVSAATADDARESLSQSRRTLNASRQNLAQARQELSALQSRRQAEVWQRQESVQNAQSKRDGLALLVQRMEIRAPVVGDVEAMNVKVGDVVQPGQPIARLVPREVDYQATSFLPEKDRAFVKAGDAVKLELDQFPHTEYGALEGRILRIGDDLASAQEIREAMGEDYKPSGATYRIDIEVHPPSSGRLRSLPLRSGMLMSVRYTLRRERPILLFFAPLRRWLDA